MTAVDEQPVDVALCIDCGHATFRHHANGCVKLDCTCTEYPVDGEQTFTTAEVVAMTGCSYRQLWYWMRDGLVGGDPRPGSGNPRTLTLEQLELVFYAVGLLSAGFTPRAALQIARTLVDPAAGHVDVTVAEIVRVRIGVRTETGAP